MGFDALTFDKLDFMRNSWVGHYVLMTWLSIAVMVMVSVQVMRYGAYRIGLLLRLTAVHINVSTICRICCCYWHADRLCDNSHIELFIVSITSNRFWNVHPRIIIIIIIVLIIILIIRPVFMERSPCQLLREFNRFNRVDYIQYIHRVID